MNGKHPARPSRLVLVFCSFVFLHAVSLCVVACAQISDAADNRATSIYRPNNSIVLGCEVADKSYLHIQQIHTTIEPAAHFILRDGKYHGHDPDWEGGVDQVQTHYMPAWSIEVHYDDAAVDRLGKWKKSTTSGNQYAVLTGRHVPEGLSIPNEFVTRSERGCMLSRKFDPNPDQADFPKVDWHAQDWDFVENRMTKILVDQGINKPWSQHSRRQLVGALANWIKDARLSVPCEETNLHPADCLESGAMYCGGAASSLVAMCSVLRIPARYFGTADHAFVEFQDDDGQWLFVDNQPETFIYLRNKQTTPPKYSSNLSLSAKKWALQQGRDAVFSGSTIDLMADPSRYGVADLPHLGWFYNWSCPRTYDGQGQTKNADLCMRPQTLHDWVFNLYTGYGKYEDDYMHRRGFFMAERMNSVFELAAMYSPRRDDLPYVCDKRLENDNIVFLMPFRDSYYHDWDNKYRIPAGPRHGVRQRFFLSDLDGVKEVVAAIILGPDDKVDHAITQGGGDWFYEVNGQRMKLTQHGGFKLQRNYQGTGMTVHRFKLPLRLLRVLQ